MKGGEFLQVDSPMNVYDHPADHFIGSFIGNPPMNFLTTRLLDEGAFVQVDETKFSIESEVANRLRSSKKDTLWLGIRAENIEPLDIPAEGTLTAHVLVVEPLGSNNLLTVKVGDSIIKVNAHSDSDFQPGHDIWLRLIPEKICWMDKDTGQLLS